MKVKDFAAKVGMKTSNVRYYCRSGLLDVSRDEQNNYREMNETDALDLFWVKTLRGYDFKVEDILNIDFQNFSHLIEEMDSNIESIEMKLEYELMKLKRMKELKQFFTSFHCKDQAISTFFVEEKYNVYTLGSNVKPTSDDLEAISKLLHVLPFSYVVVCITRNSILNLDGELDIRCGMGILKSNLDKSKICLPSSIKPESEGIGYHFYLEVENPFLITRDDIQPLLDQIECDGGQLKTDIMGRVYMKYKNQGKDKYIIGIGSRK